MTRQEDRPEHSTVQIPFLQLVASCYKFKTWLDRYFREREEGDGSLFSESKSQGSDMRETISRA